MALGATDFDGLYGMVRYKLGLAQGLVSENGWVMRVGELLLPITAAVSQELLKGDYIQAAIRVIIRDLPAFHFAVGGEPKGPPPG